MPKVDYQTLAKTLSENMSAAFLKMAKEKFSSDPTSEVHPIKRLEDGEIKVSGFDKLGSKCYISSVYFYASSGQTGSDKSTGAMVLYVRESLLGPILKGMNLLPEDPVDEKALQNACGEFCVAIANELKQALSGAGHQTTDISTPINSAGTIKGGLQCSPKAKESMELSCFLYDMRAFLVDVVLN